MLRLESRREGYLASLARLNVAPLESQVVRMRSLLGKREVAAGVVLWAQALNCCSPVECSRLLRTHNRSDKSSNTPGTRWDLSQRMNRNTGREEAPRGQCLRRQNRREGQRRLALQTRRWSMQHLHLRHLRPLQRRPSQRRRFPPERQPRGHRLSPMTQGHLSYHSAVSANASEQNLDHVLRPYSGACQRAHAETSP
jgi:hypothetical protein